MITVTLSSWQLAQLERLMLDQLALLRHNGLGSHAVTRDYEKLLNVLTSARATAAT